MIKEREKVKEFLRKYCMDYDSLEMEECLKCFTEEMDRGLKGMDSSLKMLPAYITLNEEIPLEEPVIVMDAGGTNFRIAVVYFDKYKRPVIEDFNIYSMPGSKGEISKEEFFTTIAEYMKPVLGRSKKIGFCFSYPTEILANRDGRLLQFSKEVQISGLPGEVIGGNLLNTIKQMGMDGDKKITLLNDTVATLLGGKAAYPDRIFDTYIGFILGTGTNTCYIEENKNIKKVAELAEREGSTIINIESGGYSKVKRGFIDEEFDSKTVNPGEHMFEKMVSGRYQSELILAVIKRAVEDGLLSCYFAERIKDVNKITAQEIDEFLNYPYSCSLLSSCCTPVESDEKFQDQAVLYYIIDSIIERAAMLVTVNLAAIMKKTGKGKNPCKPVCITAEGSTFYKSKLFKSRLDYYVKKFINDEKGLYCEFIKAENATLIGTAIAGLSY